MLALWQLCQKAQFSWPIDRPVTCLSGFSSLKGLPDHAAFNWSVTWSSKHWWFIRKTRCSRNQMSDSSQNSWFFLTLHSLFDLPDTTKMCKCKNANRSKSQFVKENEDDLRSFNQSCFPYHWIIDDDGIYYTTGWSNLPSWRIQYPYDSYHPQNPYNKIPTAKGIYHIPTTRSPLIHPFSMRWQSRWTTPIQPLRFGDLRISETVSGGNYTEYPPGNDHMGATKREKENHRLKSAFFGGYVSCLEGMLLAKTFFCGIAFLFFFHLLFEGSKNSLCLEINQENREPSFFLVLRSTFSEKNTHRKRSSFDAWLQPFCCLWLTTATGVFQVAEMMRLLVDVMQVAWDEAWELSTQCDSVGIRHKTVGRLHRQKIRRIWNPKFPIFPGQVAKKGFFPVENGGFQPVFHGEQKNRRKVFITISFHVVRRNRNESNHGNRVNPIFQSL